MFENNRFFLQLRSEGKEIEDMRRKYYLHYIQPSYICFK